MKTITQLKAAILPVILMLAFVAGTSSCTNQTSSDDPAKIAEEQNDAKFDNKKQENDADFLAEATAINLEEIRLGALAQEKSSNPEIKALGKMMADAHSKALTEVTALAKKKLVTVPSELPDKAVQDFTELNAKSGEDFDKAYCNKMVAGHKDAIEKFEKEVADSRDGEIKEWATLMLPELRKHLDHVFACQKKLDEADEQKNK